jgi:gliding motility-associated-like protein
MLRYPSFRCFATVLFIVISTISLTAQLIGDCIGAQVICSDATFEANPFNAGVVNDFRNPNNDKGCLESGESNEGAWYYFELRKDMPPSEGSLEFTITPIPVAGYDLVDYDFAIYGADLECDSLGSPIRCSYSSQYVSVQTGLKAGYTATSQGWLDANNQYTDGFVAPLNVLPGEGFYLFIDYFTTSSQSGGFQLEWGGPAAPYLNCVANPNCETVAVEITNSPEICQRSGAIPLSADFIQFVDTPNVIWSGDATSSSWIRNPNDPSAELDIPDQFTGQFEIYLQANEGTCSDQDTLLFTVTPAPELKLIGPSAICPDSSVTLQATAGYDQYLWNGINRSNQYTTSKEEDITLIARTLKGCSDTLNFSTFQRLPPDSLIGGKPYYCEGQASFLTLPSDIQSALWSTGATTLNLNIGVDTTISVQATDIYGCSFTDSIVLSGRPLPNPGLPSNAAICGNDSITLEGQPGFDAYLWLNGSVDSIFKTNTQGLYILEVVDSNGCSGIDSIRVVSNPLPQPMITPINQFCQGDTQILVLNQTFDTYLWSLDSANTASLSISQPGNYWVEVVDSNGCLGTASYTPNILPAPNLTIQGIPSFCVGSATTLTAAPGLTDYLWSTGATTTSINVAVDTTISLTAKGVNGCLGYAEIEVRETAAKAPFILGDTIVCQGTSVTLDAGPYFTFYDWDGLGNRQTLEVSQGGTYGISVRDTSGCTARDSITLQTIIPIPPTINGLDTICPGVNTQLRVGNNSGNFTSFLWSTGDSLDLITIDSGGIYWVEVEDISGCTSQDTIIVWEDTPPVFSITGNPYFCPGDSTTLGVNTPAQSYLWIVDSLQIPDPTVTINKANTIGVIVTAANSCTASQEIEIIPRSNPNFSFKGPTGICPGDTITVSTNEHFPSYLWSDQTTNAAVQINHNDTLQLTVVDSFGCRTTRDTVFNFYPVQQVAVIGDSTICEGEEAIFTVSDFFEDVVWNYSTASDSFTSNLEDTIRVSAIDSNGCIANGTAFLEVQPLPPVHLNGDTTFCEGETTTLKIQSHYTEVFWSFGGIIDSATFSQPYAGYVEIADSNNCRNTRPFQVVEIPKPIALAGPDQYISCGQNQVTINGSTTNTQPTLFEWSSNRFSTSKSGPSITVADSGTYVLIAVDSIYGCRSNPDYVYVYNAQYTPAIAVQITDTLDCNQTSVLIDGSQSEQNKYLSYEWYDKQGNRLNSQNTFEFSVTEPGDYTFKIVDTRFNCQSDTTFNVPSNREYPTIDAGPDQWLNCIANTVELKASMAPSSSNLSFGWLDSLFRPVGIPNDSLLTVSQTGTYYFNAHNQDNGCSSIDTVQVGISVQLPTAEAGIDRMLFCAQPTVELGDSSTSEGPDIIYEWVNSNGNFTSYQKNITVRDSGTFYLKVTNLFNQCVSYDSVRVHLLTNSLQNIEWEEFSTTCEGNADGYAQLLNIQGGVPPYSHSINGGSFTSAQVFDQLSGGTYQVVTQDSLGCNYSSNFTIPEGNNLQVSLGPDRIIELGDSIQITGRVNINPADITAIIWNNAGPSSCSGTGCLSLLDSPYRDTRYTIEVMDTNGCIAYDELLIQVITNTGLYIPNAFSPNGDGLNDIFMIMGKTTGLKTIADFSIYTRWGEKVYQVQNFLPNDPAYGWDGTFRNQILNPQVLVYQIKVEKIDGAVEYLEGGVTLMR